MKRAATLILLALFISTFDETSAQTELNKHYLGPSVGISFLGSTFQIGLNYEYALHQDDIGIVGIGGIFRYWGYSESYEDGKYSYSDVLIGAQGNYHFRIADKRFDPFAGLVLAYDAGTVDWEGEEPRDTPVYGGFWIGLHGGLRYWINPKVALNGRLSFGTLGYGAIEFGVDFKIQ